MTIQVHASEQDYGGRSARLYLDDAFVTKAEPHQFNELDGNGEEQRLTAGSVNAQCEPLTVTDPGPGATVHVLLRRSGRAGWRLELM